VGSGFVEDGAVEEVGGAGGDGVRSLRERIAEQYSAPFETLFESSAELRAVDRTTAFALLIGPLAFGRISTLTEFDYRAVAIAAVDGFLAISAASTAPAGA
jgi:hypothetical protein